MITVRFPSGFSVQYNDATWVEPRQNFCDLMTKKEGGSYVAQVPNSALLEFREPCRIYNPISDRTQEQIASLSREVRLLKAELARQRKDGK